MDQIKGMVKAVYALLKDSVRGLSRFCSGRFCEGENPNS